ncbi:hypothetical protein FHU36_003782 [Nonomuraea muscovyensis]|uniref:Uncharacterized protein n=1 Tax=Nonomuraea muscovyensis TaxID=1124761 RepID=A0A7X0EWQ3_9ACTN|nr:hypothetical protein [Nonomuraea muscovyensis]MBB6347237.1 hypothetical protein [Nonomuraea muscovyensis]
MTDTTNTTRLYICIEEVVRLLNNAECYAFVSVDEQLAYLEDRAQLLHQLVDAFGDERGRYVAQDADDRAERARGVAEKPAPMNAAIPGRHRAVRSVQLSRSGEIVVVASV